MKYGVLILGLLISSFAFASDYRLDDPAILGEYRVQKTNKHSEIQVVELIYNHDNALTVYTDRNGLEYPLSEPDKDGVVFDGEDDPNCDGDEHACYYDSHTTITLVKAKVGRKEIPQLVISITETDAFDDTGKNEETTVYVVNWTKELPYAIPFYLNTKDPKALQAVAKACKDTVEPAVGSGGLENTYDICIRTETVTYRESLKEAWPYFIKDQFGKEDKTKRFSKNDVKQKVFRKVVSRINKLNDRELKVSKEQLRELLKDQQDYVLKNYDTYYYRLYFKTAILYAVNTTDKIITTFRVEIQK